MAENGARSCQNSAHPLAPVVIEHGREREYTFLHPDEAAGHETMLDRGPTQAEVLELPPREPIELSARKISDANVPHIPL